MNIRNRFLRFGMALVLVFAGLSGSATITASGEYLFDNTVFNRRTLLVSGQDIKFPFGILGGKASYGVSRLSDDINGLRALDDTFLSGTLSWRFQGKTLLTGADISTGTWNADRMERSFVSGQIPLEWALFGPGLKLLAQFSARQGVADDNPAVTRMGVSKRTLKADAGLRYEEWEVHAAWQQERYAGIPRADYQPFLSDTAFFSAFYDVLNPFLKFIDTKTDPLPGNTIRQFSFYGFGPVTSRFYAGGSYLYRNADTDLYLPIADNEDGGIVNAFFPYITPKEERVFSVISAITRTWQAPAAYLNSMSVKLDFPVYSSASYRGYYQTDPKNLLAGLQGFYYDYYGLGTLSLETALGKNIGAKWAVSLNHKWMSRPYIAYRYFGNNAYRYHTLALVVTRAL